MRRFDDISLPDYTKAEEAINVITHLAGAVFTVIISAVMLRKSSGDTVKTAAAAVFMLGNLVMFLISSAYHALPGGYAKKVLRVTDHSAIYFSVSGTAVGFVPIIYGRVGGAGALAFSALALLGAVCGLLLCLLAFGSTRKLQTALYVVIGIALTAFCLPSAKDFPPQLLSSILTGGVILLLSVAVYGLGKKKRYIHGVFHLFIDFGLGLIFIALSRFVYI